MKSNAANSRDESLERQVALATERLHRYRLNRDKARARRLKASPQLAQAIASLLGTCAAPPTSRA